jgi:hypothetical protein
VGRKKEEEEDGEEEDGDDGDDDDDDDDDDAGRLTHSACRSRRRGFGPWDHQCRSGHFLLTSPLY